MSNPITRDKQGDAKNKTQLDLVGTITSLSNNFKPSAKACKITQNPVTLGPFLRWIDANSFRSAIVKKAIANKEDTTVIKEEII